MILIVNPIPYVCFRFLSRETVSSFLYECPKFIAFYILTERSTYSILEAMDFEEAATFPAQNALVSGSRKEELSQSPWTN